MACVSCRKPLCETHRPDLRKRLTAKLCSSNVSVGTGLLDIGFKCGEKETWPNNYICYSCRLILASLVHRKMKLDLSRMEWKQRTGHVALRAPKMPTGSSTRQKAIRYIMKAQYSDAFRSLASLPAGQKGLQHYLKKTIRKEVTALSKTRQPKITDIKSFTWDEYHISTEQCAPILHGAVRSALTKKDSNIQTTTDTRLGLIMQMIAYTRAEKKCSFLHKFLAMQLWRNGASVQSLKTLRQLGVSQSSRSARTAVRLVNKDASTEMETWNAPGSEDTFSLCVDNVRWVSTSSHKNKVTMKCNSFALKDRVQYDGLDPDARVPASDMPLHTFLPSEEDYVRLRERMVVIVQRILRENTLRFKHSQVPDHIMHTFSEQSSTKSEYINTGLINENPCTLEGAVGVLDSLNKLVKTMTAVHGDCGAVRILDEAKQVRSQEAEEVDKCLNLHPVPQEFHFRALTMEDTLKEFLDGTNSNDRGTLHQLKVHFDHKFTSDVLKNSNNVSDFLLFITIAYTMGIAADIEGRDTLDSHDWEIRDSRPLATEIVRRVWRQLPMQHVADVTDATCAEFRDKLCWPSCTSDSTVDLIECSNLHCSKGRWFHFDCLRNPDEICHEEDWFCSQVCRKLGSSSVCSCRKQREGEIIECANPKCQRGAVFHKSCVNASSGAGRWFCSWACKKARKAPTDELQDYVEEVLWRCLLHEACRDAEREGDGEAMLAHWRIYIPDLWNRKHWRYMSVAHRFLAQAAGFTSMRFAHQIIHNRTVNVDGMPGHNLAIDTFMQIVTDELEELVKNKTQGTYTVEGLERASQITGSLGFDLDRIFSTLHFRMEEHDVYDRQKRFGVYRDDVRRFLDEFQEDELFALKVNRKLDWGRQIHASEGITNAAQLKQYLKEECRNMDRAFQT